jgi:hypothetical protein
MKNAKTEIFTHWPCLPLHRATRTVAADTPATIVPVRAEPCARCARRAPQAAKLEPVPPPSAIERPLYVPGGREYFALAEYLRQLPWERNGAR